MFLRSAEDPVVVVEQPGVGLEDVTIFDLIASFNEALKRVKVNEVGEIIAERFTLADGIESILGRIQRETQVVFTTLFQPLSTRHEIIYTFLALLELIRLHQVVARQEAVFGDIVIMRPEGGADKTDVRRQTTDASPEKTESGQQKADEANVERSTSNTQLPMEERNKI